jgi:hypothetical protein
MRRRLPTGEIPWRVGDPDPTFEETLRLAVACWMVEMDGLDLKARLRRLPPGAVALISTRGDTLQWRGAKGRAAKGTAATFNALAAGMAAAAVLYGGVTAFDVHACVHDHRGCPNDRPPAEPFEWPVVNPLDEYEALLDAEEAGRPCPTPRNAERQEIPAAMLAADEIDAARKARGGF